MLLEIDDDYIQWVKDNCPEPMTDDEVGEYVNEVLRKHRESWDDLEP